jgi:hypothetical protein
MYEEEINSRRLFSNLWSLIGLREKYILVGTCTRTHKHANMHTWLFNNLHLSFASVAF